MKLRPGEMKATFKMDPFPHVLLRDIYTKGEWETCMREFHKLDPHLLPPEYSGSARHKKTGQTLKWNSGMFLTEMYPNAECIPLTRRHITQQLTDQIDCTWWVSQWESQNTQRWMLSRYVDGQYYNAHKDASLFTVLTWFHHTPKPFTGGDLIFPDYNNYTIPCNNNTGIIFYGPLRHEVPPIKGTGRYCLTCFATLKN